MILRLRHYAIWHRDAVPEDKHSPIKTVDLIKWKKISSQKMFQALYNLKMDLLCLSTKNSELNGGMG